MEEKIAAQVAEWSSDANEAVELSLIGHGPEGATSLTSFHPRFTYPIFGDEESIFGYKNLRIKIAFLADSCKPRVELSYSDKFKPVANVHAADIEATLKDFLPSEAFDKGNHDGGSQEVFKPPGQMIRAFTREGKKYEIYCCELSEATPKLLMERIQIMTSFFVEGGVPLDLDEEKWSRERWRAFFVYERLPTMSSGIQYCICGYSTSYRFLTYRSQSYRPKEGQQFEQMPPEPIHVFELPNRSRISQFVIFPSAQGKGLGRHLYNTMVEEFLKDDACIEITVEDPNEAFDDLRDYCDFERFTLNGTFAQLKLNAAIDPKLVMKRGGSRVPTSHLLDRALFEQLRVQNKVAPRQWKRLVDLYFLSQIPLHSRQAGVARLTQRAKAADPGDKAMYLWRLLVKQRIYRQNKDIMAQFDLPERIEKLEQTLEGQIADYERLLARIEEAKTQSRTEEDIDITAENLPARNKRRVIDDDDDEDDNSVTESRSKRAKTVEISDTS